MKKKLLLSLVITGVLVCLFALSVGAKTVISESNLDENGDIVADLLADLGGNHHLLSVDVAYTDTNGQVQNGKFYYETSFWDARNQRQIKFVYVPKDFDLTQMICLFDKADFNQNGSYESTDLIKLHEGGGGFKIYSYDSYENGTFTNTVNIIPNIQRVSYSKYFVKLPDSGFGWNAPQLTTITYNGREPIEGALIVSPLIDEIFGGAFGGQGSSETENTLVTGFTKVIFEDREISVNFGQYCFTRCKIEEIYFGKGTYELSNRERIALLFEKKYANGEGASLKTVILHKEAIIGSGEISWNVGSYDVVVLGKESESKEFYETNNQNKLPCAKSVTYNPCYYVHTTEDDYNCETALICTECGTILEEAKEHTLTEVRKYENGYLSAGVYTVSCTNDGCTYNVTEDAPALFTCNGYSAPENGEGGIAVDYSVNLEAIAEYERLSETTVSYGIYAATQSGLGDKDIFDENGEVLGGALTVALTKRYTKVSIKLVGFNTDALKATKFTLGAYVEVVGTEGKKISYLQSGKVAEGDKYAFVSFNDVVNNALSK